MRTVDYNELPAEIGLSLGATLLDTSFPDFKAYLEHEGTIIYPGENGYPVISAAQFKKIHYRKVMRLSAAI